MWNVGGTKVKTGGEYLDTKPNDLQLEVNEELDDGFVRFSSNGK